MRTAEFLSLYLVLFLQWFPTKGERPKVLQFDLYEEMETKFSKQLESITSTQKVLQKSISSMKEVLSEMAELVENQIPLDCSGAKKRGNWRSIQKIKPPGHPSLNVRCDQFTAGGGWTVAVYRTAEHLFDKSKPYKFGNKFGGIRRRYNDLVGYADSLDTKNYSGSTELHRPEASSALVNFNRTWSEYKNGFGSAHHEHWIGNDVLHALTKDRPWEAIVVAKDWNGKEAHAFWKSFRISGEAERYRLEISGYDSSKSSLEDGLAYHNGRSFSTIDADNDDYEAHCAKKYGGGWWFNKCHVSHLTGTHLRPGSRGQHSVHWLPWKSSSETLMSAALMIRPPEPSPL